jgi:hypothetical protein
MELALAVIDTATYRDKEGLQAILREPAKLNVVVVHVKPSTLFIILLVVELETAVNLERV